MVAAVIFAALLATVVSGASASFCDTPEGRWIDLTHPFDEATTLAYPGLKPYRMRITDYKYTEGGFW